MILVCSFGDGSAERDILSEMVDPVCIMVQIGSVMHVASSV